MLLTIFVSYSLSFWGFYWSLFCENGKYGYFADTTVFWYILQFFHFSTLFEQFICGLWYGWVCYISYKPLLVPVNYKTTRNIKWCHPMVHLSKISSLTVAQRKELLGRRELVYYTKCFWNIKEFKTLSWIPNFYLKKSTVGNFLIWAFMS